MVLQRLLPAIVLALGILAGTAVSAWLEDSGWLVMAGPLVLAGSLVAAGVLAQRRCDASAARTRAAIGVGAIFVVAAAIIAWRDPARVANIVPLLGAGGLVVLGTPKRCARPRVDAKPGA